MAFYYGTVQGGRGVASRLGTRQSGLNTVAASWSGAVRTELYQVKGGAIYARVSLFPWHGAGKNVLLYDGPVDGTPVSGEALS